MQQAELLHASELAFLNESGKNLATKADVAEITAQIEAVKLEYARQLELSRSAMTAQIAQHSFRYEKEFEILIKLAALLHDLEDQSTGLRPAHAMAARQSESAEARATRVSGVNKILIELDSLANRCRPFFCEHVYDSIDELLTTVDQEAVKYQDGMSEGGQSFWWYLEGHEAGCRIRDQARVASNAIRTRTKSWDQIAADPGVT